MSKNRTLSPYLPYILPILSLLLVSFMFFRWYRARTSEAPRDFLNSENLQLESFPAEQEESFIKGTSDFNTVSMEATGVANGEIRYQLEGNKLHLMVTADLPKSEESYAVWLRNPQTQSQKRVFNLVEGKAGYFGTVSLSTEVLPVDVLVSKSSDLLLNDVVLEGKIEAQVE